MNQEILSTLAHYQAEKETPLSAFEIYKYLHNSEKINAQNITQGDIRNTLQDLLQKNLIKEKEGFYFLKPLPEDAVKKRLAREKTSVQKWKKTKRVVWLMQVIPFIKTIAVTGSLSMNNATKESDIDIFIIAEKNRVWTVRTLSVFLTHIIGQRRRGNIINNKICLNYFLAENTEPPIQNLGYANIFLRAIPVSGKENYLKFFSQNSYWIQKYFKNLEPSLNDSREAKKNHLLNLIRKTLESILSNKIGDSTENYLFNWQTNRINRKLTKDRPSQNLQTSDVWERDLSHLVYTKDVIMLHYPNPRNEEVMEKYNKIIQ